MLALVDSIALGNPRRQGSWAKGWAARFPVRVGEPLNQSRWNHCVGTHSKGQRGTIGLPGTASQLSTSWTSKSHMLWQLCAISGCEQVQQTSWNQIVLFVLSVNSAQGASMRLTRTGE